MRARYIWDKATKKMVPIDDWAGRQHAEAPFVVTDEMAPMLSHVDRQIYTSKSRYKQAVKAAGYEITGGEVTVKVNPQEVARKREQDVRDAVTQAYYMVRDGNAPLSEQERAQCKEINERIKNNY